jgi:fructose 5-dehydrogenase cytochrome subunit
METVKPALSGLGIVALLMAVGCASVFAADSEEIARGKYMATASDCEACHTRPGGKPLAGGLALASPLGVIYSTNITPSKQYGIGSYSLEQFSSALRRGIRGDGAHLYPAMPYASYARLTNDDIKALYAYFMQQVQPVDEPAANQTSLPFPYNMRLSMAFWNALFLDSKPFVPDPSQSAEWNRGKYLVDGAAHCGECHTPRGLLMQQKPSQEFGGAVIGSWYAPNITPSAISGIGAMSADELFRYLKFGKVAGKAQAGGEMALAVQLSFSQLRDEDLHAMVSYLRSVPPVTEPHAKSKFTQGQPFTGVASFRGVGGMSYERSLPGGAAQLFAANCATCHGIAAQGSRDTYFPSLFHNSALAGGGGRNVIAAILFGISRSTTDGLAFMPGFGGKTTDIAEFSDEQVAQLTNFLLQHYGEASNSITPNLVKQVRDGQAPKPVLMTLVTGGEWIGGALLLALAIWFIARHFSRTFARSQSS